MNLIYLVIIVIAFSSAEAFIPYSLANLRLYKGETTTWKTKATTTEATTTEAVTTETTTILTSTTGPASTMPSETTSLQPTKTMFEEHLWLDNIVQLVCERGLRLIKLLIQKFIMKQNIPLSEFLMNVLVV